MLTMRGTFFGRALIGVWVAVVAGAGNACADEEETLVEEVFEVRELAASETEREGLAECVISNIAPTSWDVVGGPASYAWRNGKLVVSNSESACRQIGKLLDVLGELPAAGPKETIKAPEKARHDVAAFDVGPAEFEIVVYPVLDILSDGGRIDAPTPGMTYDVDTLIEAVTRFIAPTSWDAVGGPGSIQVYEPRGAMVICQEKEHHKLIESLLGALRKAPHSKDFLKKAPDPLAIAVGTDKSVKDADSDIALYPVADLVHYDERSEAGNFDSLMECITTSIAPESWDAVGGSGSVLDYAMYDVLIVSHTKEAQTEIRGLLAALRKIPRYTKATAGLEPQRPAVIGKHKRGETELQAVVYDVGRSVLTREGNTDFESLIEAIEQIEPATWDVAKGPGTCRELTNRGALVVVNTSAVQAKVAAAIEKFRAE